MRNARAMNSGSAQGPGKGGTSTQGRDKRGWDPPASRSMSVSFFWLKSIFGVWALPEKARGAGENGRGRSTKTLKRASCFTPDIIGAIFAHASSTLGGGIFWKLTRRNKRKDGPEVVLLRFCLDRCSCFCITTTMASLDELNLCLFNDEIS
jgi:hypothetical protein